MAGIQNPDWYMNPNYMRFKLSKQKFKLYWNNRACFLNHDVNVVPINFPEAIPTDQQPLHGQGDKWSERARYFVLKSNIFFNYSSKNMSLGRN